MQSPPKPQPRPTSGYQKNSENKSGPISFAPRPPSIYRPSPETTPSESAFRRGSTSEGSLRKTFPKAVVLFDFTAQTDRELSIKKGETVEVLKATNQDGWWFGRYNGHRGHFPAKYVRIMEEQESVNESKDESNSNAYIKDCKLKSPNTTEQGKMFFSSCVQGAIDEIEYYLNELSEDELNQPYVMEVSEFVQEKIYQFSALEIVSYLGKKHALKVLLNNSKILKSPVGDKSVMYFGLMSGNLSLCKLLESNGLKGSSEYTSFSQWEYQKPFVKAAKLGNLDLCKFICGFLPSIPKDLISQMRSEGYIGNELMRRQLSMYFQASTTFAPTKMVEVENSLSADIISTSIDIDNNNNNSIREVGNSKNGEKEHKRRSDKHKRKSDKHKHHRKHHNNNNNANNNNTNNNNGGDETKNDDIKHESVNDNNDDNNKNNNNNNNDNNNENKNEGNDNVIIVVREADGENNIDNKNEDDKNNDDKNNILSSDVDDGDGSSNRPEEKQSERNNNNNNDDEGGDEKKKDEEEKGEDSKHQASRNNSDDSNNSDENSNNNIIIAENNEKLRVSLLISLFSELQIEVTNAEQMISTVSPQSITAYFTHLISTLSNHARSGEDNDGEMQIDPEDRLLLHTLSATISTTISDLALFENDREMFMQKRDLVYTQTNEQIGAAASKRNSKIRHKKHRIAEMKQKINEVKMSLDKNGDHLVNDTILQPSNEDLEEFFTILPPKDLANSSVIHQLFVKVRGVSYKYEQQIKMLQMLPKFEHTRKQLSRRLRSLVRSHSFLSHSDQQKSLLLNFGAFPSISHFYSLLLGKLTSFLTMMKLSSLDVCANRGLHAVDALLYSYNTFCQYDHHHHHYQGKATAWRSPFCNIASLIFIQPMIYNDEFERFRVNNSKASILLSESYSTSQRLEVIADMISRMITFRYFHCISIFPLNDIPQLVVDAFHRILFYFNQGGGDVQEALYNPELLKKFSHSSPLSQQLLFDAGNKSYSAIWSDQTGIVDISVSPPKFYVRTSGIKNGDDDDDSESCITNVNLGWRIGTASEAKALRMSSYSNPKPLEFLVHLEVLSPSYQNLIKK